MGVLEIVQPYRAERRERLRATEIGADLIPRATPDDPRYAGVDLVARGRDVMALRSGMARLDRPPRSLPADLREIAQRIARELLAAGPDEIGRYATDILYAYADVPIIAPDVETAMYYAWALAIAPSACASEGACDPTDHCDSFLSCRPVDPSR